MRERCRRRRTRTEQRCFKRRNAGQRCNALKSSTRESRGRKLPKTSSQPLDCSAPPRGCLTKTPVRLLKSWACFLTRTALSTARALVLVLSINLRHRHQACNIISLVRPVLKSKQRFSNRFRDMSVKRRQVLPMSLICLWINNYLLLVLDIPLVRPLCFNNNAKV